jgi:hypothetical protein
MEFLTKYTVPHYDFPDSVGLQRQFRHPEDILHDFGVELPSLKVVSLLQLALQQRKFVETLKLQLILRSSPENNTFRVLVVFTFNFILLGAFVALAV